jgi:cellulose synthase/poly-beta-1,6-N-acetylglucosamine synthase-like glycosyltransferase/peptidoglycan/xylan/chitin deacetylase (PgdA/CDA1 family)
MRHRATKKAPQDGKPIYEAHTSRGIPLLFLLAVLIVCALASGIAAVRAMQQPPYLPPAKAGVAAPRQIAEVMHRCIAPGKDKATDWDGVPVIGDGLFLRVAAVDHRRARLSDPFTGQYLRQLTLAERHATQNCPYTVEWFAQIPERTIFFTYDDGPSPIWTRKILPVLEANHVPATFFNIGENVADNPDVFRDVIAHGFTVGNHTLTHLVMANASDETARDQILRTQRIFRAVGSYQTNLFRLPYGGNDLGSVQHNVLGYLVPQQLGLTDVGFNVDPADFAEYGNQDDAHNIPVPRLSGQGVVIVMHDAGGTSRQATVELTRQMIKQAKEKGYRFGDIRKLLPAKGPAVQTLPPSLADNAAYRLIWMQRTVVTQFSEYFLLISTALALLQTLVQSVLALWSDWSWRRTLARRDRDQQYQRRMPRRVSVLIAAFNEGPTIAETVARVFEFAHLCRFAIEVVVINDGSEDNTGTVLDQLVAYYRSQGRVLKVAHIPNGGKGNALNYAIKTPGLIRGAVTVLLDGDTKIDEHTIPKLVRHFADARIGAVTGRIQVINQAHTVWQWLLAAFQQADYNTGIGLARQAQFAYNGVLIMSGACAAIRTDVVRGIGGFPLNTSAEDADLANMLRWQGYRIVVELEAKSYTEVPRTFRALLGQHRRWWQGIYQVIWKHSRLPGHPGQAGVGISMAQAVMSLAMALFAIPIGWAITILALLQGNWAKVLTFLVLFTAIRMFQTVVAMITMRELNKDVLTAVFYRLINDPLSVILAYQTAWAIATGQLTGWNKVPRVGSAVPLVLPVPTEALSEPEGELSPAGS